MTSFPNVLWGKICATFLPQGEPLPEEAPVRASLVFALDNGRFVLADIAGRGWCIPSGHLLPEETAEAAARREAYEEAGVTLGPIRLLGHYLLTDTETGAVSLASAFLAPVAHFGERPDGTESQGVRLAAPQELPALYYAWDALIETMFAWALQQQQDTASPASPNLDTSVA